MPVASKVSYRLAWRAALGASFGVLGTGWLSYLWMASHVNLPYLIAPMGASAVLIFALPNSPLAQPWSVVFGNVLSASVGVLCGMVFGHNIPAATSAVGLAILAMFLTRSLHPPGGAIALVAVLGGTVIEESGWFFVLAPVALNSMLLLGFAILYHRWSGETYPHFQRVTQNSHGTGDAPMSARLGVASHDLDEVIKRHGKLLDISRDDLEMLFTQTEIQVYQRRHGQIACKDIMSRKLVTVRFETSLEDCWQLLRTHKIRLLPVVDEGQHLIGIVTLIDFLKNADLDVYHDFDLKLRQLMNNARSLSASHVQVAGHLMTSTLTTATEDTSILELVKLLSDEGLHQIPILNKDQQLTGLVTQSDLIAALYRMQIDKVLQP
jgi:CBS domain-containing membrane protein